MSDYASFLARKQRKPARRGPSIEQMALHPSLHEWQARITEWAISTQRAAIWADTGLGKTRMQIEWARMSGNSPLIVAPLAVCAQTVAEAEKIGVEARFVRNGDEITGPGIISVTNYERVSSMPASKIDAVVLDESSILKQSDGKTRNLLIEHFQNVPARLACSATPAPNDPEELTNQSEYLGRMARNHMLAAYFVHDKDGWRLKGHARGPMIDWMSSWALAIRRPSDIGGDDAGYVLPGLEIKPELIPADMSGALVGPGPLGGVTERARLRRETLTARVARAAELVAAEPDEPWLLWCGLNDEANALAAAIPGAVNVHGAMSPEEKAELLLGFAAGDYRVLITKPSIASFGMNFQHCARMAFVGLGDSYEQYYQSIRRCYRYGQTRVVHAHVVLSELEAAIAENVMRKEQQASEITSALIERAALNGAVAA
ncbi:helicase-related protein [Mycobacteroides abscessus]|uniref:helicase-related protein n=1 Tax=Mycobacteroides abscessus TaxID=36809 RepID=UPI00092772EF|nr:DEAD/DEAH box helicase [Mycobacteroides abscessus]DAZ90307.1 TPA_asm: DNA helicase [Mycobacterium phage prophiFSQJ01-1]SII40453.1 Helicase conserved C-terminal domain [Mycobacteroides abscessus subsp. abscessus]SIK14791.1 Helicase conserved C-terminal domain [Mycobacteroides abscessus subsp. abscessus]SIN25007.1 Helicase conserved C-terminal domain [Mycobacteroides abscessus subsp. abscessus]SLI51913.1 Helicase conserved C-terminal domain [Mycobacteroides abscessus subsp. abscessus]